MILRHYLACLLFTLSTGAIAAGPLHGYKVESTKADHPSMSVSTKPVPPPNFSEIVLRSMQSAHVPGLAIAKIEQGELAWTRVFGKRAPGVAMQADTVFNVASLTKPVFALMALHLVADGKISLETRLDEDWIDPDVADDPRHKALTPRVVLSHQTGFQNWRGNAKLAFAFAPGARHEYSGEGYEYLRRALEHRTGKTMTQLIEENVLDKVDMKQSSFGWTDRVQDHLAVGFEVSSEPYPMEYLRDRQPNAAANLFTTIGDYGRFAAWVARGADLPGALFKDMQRPQLTGKRAEQFGLGWRLIKLGEHTVLSHDGRENGVRTQVFVDPSSGEGLVVLSNSDNGELMTRPLTQASMKNGHSLMAAVDRDVWTYLMRMPREQLPNIARVIVSSPSFMAKWLHAVDAALIVGSGLRPSQKKSAHEAIDPFIEAMVAGKVGAVQAKALVEMMVVTDEDGPCWREQMPATMGTQWLTGLIARPGAQNIKQKTVEVDTQSIVVPATRLASYEGKYRLTSNQLLIDIRNTADGLEAAAEGMPVVKLYPLSQTLFAFKEDNTRFEFVTDQDNQITGVRVIWSESRSEIATKVQ